MGSLGLTCDQLKINFLVGSSHCIVMFCCKKAGHEDALACLKVAILWDSLYLGSYFWMTSSSGHNVCKTVCLSEELLVYGYTIRAVLTQFRTTWVNQLRAHEKTFLKTNQLSGWIQGYIVRFGQCSVCLFVCGDGVVVWGHNPKSTPLRGLYQSPGVIEWSHSSTPGLWSGDPDPSWGNQCLTRPLCGVKHWINSSRCDTTPMLSIFDSNKQKTAAPFGN
jgi:hypothetical protein